MFGEQAVATSKGSRSRLRVNWVRLISVGVFVFALWAGFNEVGKYVGAHTTAESATVVVRPGDTVWSIARDNGPYGWDVRKTVAIVQQLNGLDDQELGTLQPGTSLKVPLK